MYRDPITPPYAIHTYIHTIREIFEVKTAYFCERMTKNDIITQLYNSIELNNALKSMPDSLRDDVKQNSFLKICLLREDLFFELQQKNKLKGYCYRIIINTLKDELKKQTTTEVKEIVEENTEYSENYINFEALDYFESKILQLVQVLGSASEVAKQTEIPVRTIHYTIAKTITKIKNNGEKYIGEYKHKPR